MLELRRLTRAVLRLVTAMAMVTALVMPVSASTRVKIASVAPEYTPTAGPAMPEPVSMQGFSFEVEKETGRARVVVEYTYPDQQAFGLEGGIGPEPARVQIPGLRYDGDEKAVVYGDKTKTVICATVRSRKFLFWKSLGVVPSGACTVTSQLASHEEDNGWSVNRYRSLDTYFQVR
jgi:hypothetical protein